MLKLIKTYIETHRHATKFGVLCTIPAFWGKSWHSENCFRLNQYKYMYIKTHTYGSHMSCFYQDCPVFQGLSCGRTDIVLLSHAFFRTSVGVGRASENWKQRETFYFILLFRPVFCPVFPDKICHFCQLSCFFSLKVYIHLTHT